jgi:hypothetical protein
MLTAVAGFGSPTLRKRHRGGEKMAKKKGKFTEEILEFLEMLAAEKKGPLRKIINDLLKAAHEVDAHLEITGKEPEGYMAWATGGDWVLEDDEEEDA